MTVSVLVLTVGWLPAVADSSVYYSGGKAIPLDPAPDQVAIELEPGADRSKVAAELATRGMPTMIPPTPQGVTRAVRLVPVLRVDGETLAQIRTVPGIQQVRKVYRNRATGRTMVATDRVVVQFKPGLPGTEVGACLGAYGLRLVRSFEGLPDTYLAQVTGAEGDAVAAAAAAYQDNRVSYSHPDFVADITPAQITDTYYPLQWHLNNLGLPNGDLADADVDWPEAWEEVWTLPGLDKVTVAVHDDSLQKSHIDLKDGYFTGYDFWDMDTDPSPGYFDDNHGTAVAGVAAARLNGIGVVGAAPTARLVGIRWGYYYSDIAQAFLYAVRTNVDVINNSWGFPFTEPPDVVSNAIHQAATTGRRGKGMVVVFAAHNFNYEISVGSPIAALPDVIAIGASNSKDVRSWYSNFGPELSVMAPSNDIYYPSTKDVITTDVMDDPNLGLPTRGYNNNGVSTVGYPDELPDGNYTMHFGGTSSSAPLVSGIVGLILGVNPGLTAEQVRRILEHTADPIDPVGANYDPITGHSIYYGYGRVNAYQAVLAAKRSANGLTWPPPVRNLYLTGTSTIKMTWRNPTEEVATVMVVHGTINPITWTPKGMRTEDPNDYSVGQFVAPGVQVVQNDLSESYTADPGPGAHYYAVFVQNANKRWSWGRSASTVLGAKSAPKASLTATPRTGPGPLTVEFTGGALDMDMENTVFTYAWDFGDGATAGNVQAITHKYQSPGTYLARLTVTDETGLAGTATAMIRVTELANKPPIARILLSPGDGEAPHTVQLRAVASDPDGTINQYTWDFGDGSVAAGQIVEHTYVNPGAYAITLEVIDNRGASAKATVIVSVWKAETGTPKTSGSAAETQNPLVPNCGACGVTTTPMWIATVLGWGLLHLGRRRKR